MARLGPRAAASETLLLSPLASTCPECGLDLRADYTQHRKVVTLSGNLDLNLQIRRCQNRDCKAFHKPVRPEVEGHYVLPHHEIGLDVMALSGSLRHQQHRTRAEIHKELKDRGVDIGERTLTDVLARFEELLSLRLADRTRLRTLLAAQGRVVLGIDGLQPDVGNEVLWVVRDCLSGEVLAARALLSAREADLRPLLEEVRDAVGVPVAGVVSDGQHSIRNAVASALPGVPHQLCHYHYLREAARPLYEADRHAKKELKKAVRGVKQLERELEGKTDDISVAMLGYCAAVRSALNDDHRPPLKPSGLELHRRLQQVTDSLRRIAKKGGTQPSA